MNGKSTRKAQVTLACLAVLTAGCSSEQREYAIPNDLCGIPVTEKEVSPLLPPGEAIEVRKSQTSDWSTACRTVVDRVRVLSIHTSKVEKFYDPMAEAEEYKFTNRKRMGKLPFDGAGAVGDKNAMVTARCDAPDAPYVIVDVIVDAGVNDDVTQRRADITEFIKTFTPKVKKETGCTT